MTTQQSPTATAAEKYAVCVASPWLATMCSFLGGVYIDTLPLRIVNASGDIVANPQVDPGTVRCDLALALDREELKGLEKSLGAGKPGRTEVLFEEMPYMKGKEGVAYYFDPASMPFVGQRLLGALASSIPDRYSYFQRRLAEFQSRILGTVNVGRRLIGAVPLFDVTCYYRYWLQAAAERYSGPPWKLVEAWGRGEQQVYLDKALETCRKKEWIVLYSVATPAPLRERLQTLPYAMELPPPRIENDEGLFLFFYDIYLSIWNFRKHGDATLLELPTIEEEP
ncbi:MAG: hypothetical protein K9L28_00745 [Synergistales bacterium]|nr:hypothetical protein [Synergistales bacterium]